MIDGPNLYVYVNNNPVNLIDPWGLCGEKPWWRNLGFLLQLSISAINKGTSTYFGQWADTIKDYAPGWTQGIARATNFQNAFQRLGLLQGSVGYTDILNKVAAGEILASQGYTAIGIHAIGMITKAVITTGAGAWGFVHGGPWGGVGAATTIGTVTSVGIDYLEKLSNNLLGIQ